MRRFRYITLPLLRPLIAVQLLFGVIYAAYQFAIPYVMLGSNPGPDADLMMTLIVRQSFSNNLFGLRRGGLDAADARDARVGGGLVPRLPARPGGRHDRHHALAPRAQAPDRPRPRRAHLARAAVMLAPVFWLVASSLQTDGQLATRQRTTCCTRRFTAFSRDVEDASTSSATSSTALIICTAAALLATAFASTAGYALARFQLPRRAAVRRSASSARS